jgi:hypothetical protein
MPINQVILVHISGLIFVSEIETCDLFHRSFISRFLVQSLIKIADMLVLHVFDSLNKLIEVILNNQGATLLDYMNYRCPGSLPDSAFGTHGFVSLGHKFDLIQFLLHELPLVDSINVLQ